MWKRPIPIDLKERFGKQKSAYAVYLQLLLDAVDHETNVWTVTLQRGQVLYWRWKYDGYLPIKGSSVDASCQTIAKKLSLITLNAGNRYTIITLHNYDDIVTMQATDQQQHSKKPSKKDLPIGTVIESRKKNKKEDNSIGLTPTPDEWFEWFKKSVTEKIAMLEEIAQKYKKDLTQEIERCRRRHQSKGKKIKSAYATMRNRLLPKKREEESNNKEADKYNSLFRECGWAETVAYTDTLGPDMKDRLYRYLLKRQQKIWLVWYKLDRVQKCVEYIVANNRN